MDSVGGLADNEKVIVRTSVVVLALVAAVGGGVLWAQQPEPDFLEDCTPGDTPASFTTDPYPEGVELVKVSDLTDVTSGFPYGDGMLITQRTGEVWLDDELWWTEPDVLSEGAEQGLLDIHVLGDIIYTSVINPEGDLEVRTRTGPGPFDVWLTVDQPHEFHNGGNLETTPDGNLFVSLGDGGPSGDPNRYGQDLEELKGSILRLTPDGEIPADNPTVDGEPVAQWVYGVRNAWRMTVHDGDLWFGDVGNWCFEEVNVVAAAGVAEPVNFGWSSYEGTSRGQGGEVAHQPPVLEYGRETGCAIVGGLFWDDMFLFGDYCQGWVYGYDGETVFDLGVEVPMLTTFTDGGGEVWVASQTDGVYAIRYRSSS